MLLDYNPDLYHHDIIENNVYHYQILKIYNQARQNGYIYGQNATKDYCKKNKLHSIISGHQDTVNLGLLSNKLPDDINFNKGVNLYQVESKHKHNFKEKIEFTLNPTIDFHALVTATCTESKKLIFDTYLILQQKEQI
jgi:recombination DNA repair RAD52 pathway protein